MLQYEINFNEKMIDMHLLLSFNRFLFSSSPFLISGNVILLQFNYLNRFLRIKK